ncbi:hypothetical protein [Stutzerimonas nitrititolerans]|uniref:hypothetical protein n=1 Tax=Stutzerimonas nitrititolerans TaxID=2482751 RepID=UPI002899ADAA|nr:hypothetical protein [Stutzerimonas nitrititolerans]
MFIWLLVVTLAVSALVCFIATRFSDKPIGSILTRLVSEELSFAWHRYITFAIYVVGISGGGRIWALERYITPNTEEASVVQLNAARWTRTRIWLPSTCMMRSGSGRWRISQPRPSVSNRTN